MPQQKYIMAVRHDRVAAVANDWRDRLRGIPGVSVGEGFGRQVQFTADAEAIDRVRAAFPEDFLIEEVTDRSAT